MKRTSDPSASQSAVSQTTGQREAQHDIGPGDSVAEAKSEGQGRNLGSRRHASNSGSDAAVVSDSGAGVRPPRAGRFLVAVLSLEIRCCDRWGTG